jgi:hypothetical protein
MRMAIGRQHGAMARHWTIRNESRTAGGKLTNNEKPAKCGHAIKKN